jgi:alkylhydroperoxidase/carboxymuconolactone decarboxylase family protein YurZ
MSMHDDERRAAGMAKRRQILGDAHVDRAVSQATPLSADFDDLITRFVWGEVWTRDGLDVRSRRVLVIGTLIALGRWEELALHARAAVSQGALSVDEVREIVLQQAVYCGVPAARQALAVIGDALNQPSDPL